MTIVTVRGYLVLSAVDSEDYALVRSSDEHISGH